MNEFLKELYETYCSTDSDIYHHLPMLFNYAKKCDHVTEMGARSGRSTVAFLYANPKRFISYDYQYADPEPHSVEDVEKLKAIFAKCQSAGSDCQYVGADVLKIEIEPTDLLFVDTWHCYEQVCTELKLHADKVRKFIIFHDTFTYGETGEVYNDCDPNHPCKNMQLSGKGIKPAIEEFLEQHPEWDVRYETNTNNGLMIVAKKV